MTKEELEKEAEEYSFRFTLDKPWVCEVERKQIMAHFEKGYLAGAEPREKRIEELEAENEQIKNSDTLCKLIGEHKRKIAELEAQIEKMKNCRNCKNEKIEGACGHFTQVGWCRDWELAD